MTEISTGLIQSEQSKNTIKRIAQARLNKKVSFADIKCEAQKEEERHIRVNDTFYVDYFKCGKSPYIKKTISIEDIFEIIKTGDGNQQLIAEARNFGKYTEEYDTIKIKKLPSVRFNFNFNIKASDRNIKVATGLIYLDVDDVDSIDNTNKYIFASWKSLSSTGYGILVKIDGLTLDNFSTNYNEVSTIIGIKSDIGAKKATQQTILSYDENIYINNSSLVFKAKEKVSFTNIKCEAQKEKEKHIRVNDTFSDYTGTTRFNNFSDYFEDGDDETPYRVFTETKQRMSIPFIPKSVIGNRTNNMFAYVSQVAINNASANFNFLKAVANTFNKYCYPNLSDDKVNAVVNNVLKKKENNEILLNENVERRLIFNPNCKFKLTKEEKKKIVAVEVGKIRTEKTKKEMYDVLENWDFENDGAINQKKVADVLGKGIATVKRNWSDFKDYAKELNQDVKSKNIQLKTVAPTKPTKLSELTVLGDSSTELSGFELYLLQSKKQDAEKENAEIEAKQIEEQRRQSEDPNRLIDTLRKSYLNYRQMMIIEKEIKAGDIVDIVQLNKAMEQAKSA